METIVVNLTPIEAELFVKFQKHRSLIGLIDSVNGFDMKNGSIDIHFDAFGRIASLNKHEHYRVNIGKTHLDTSV